jgi:hypothetical protein
MMKPYIDTDLIDYLEHKWPNKLPTTELAGFELGKLVGIQEVISHCRGMLKAQDREPPVSSSFIH